ncbi:MAG: hypothetical protein ACLP00_30225, partial [Terracidiphilus sp.]
RFWLGLNQPQLQGEEIMETSRRNMLRYLLMAPASVALQRLSAQAQERPRAVAGYLNLYLEGPFSFVYLPAQKSVLILAPITSQHHEPSFTSEMDEKVVIKTYDYALVGPTPATQPTWIYPNQAIQVNRLLIPSAAIGMDQGGTIDKGKKRYFSLRVPNPNTITPWHPVNVTVNGKNSPFSSPTLLPVGYTFSYKNTNFSGVKVKCLTDSSKSWDPSLHSLPNQKDAEIIVSMTSLLDDDPCHQVAINSFADGRNLYDDVNPGKKLDLALSYPNTPSDCEKHRHSEAHTGADCKAAVLEIDGASNSVTLG